MRKLFVTLVVEWLRADAHGRRGRSRGSGKTAGGIWGVTTGGIYGKSLASGYNMMAMAKEMRMMTMSMTILKTKIFLVMTIVTV